MDRGVWLATVHGVQSQTQLNMHACLCIYIYTYTYFLIFFSIMVYHRVLNNSLCYTVGPCCL